MHYLDVRSVFANFWLINMVCAVVMVFLWRQNHRRYPGIGLWVTAYIFQVVGVSLILWRGVIPDILSVSGTCFIIVGPLILFIGLEQFVGKKSWPIPNYVLIGLFTLVNYYFFFMAPSLMVRIVNVSLAVFIFSFQGAFLLFHRADIRLRRITLGPVLVLFLFCLVSVIRIIRILTAPPGLDNLGPYSGDTIFFLIYLFLFVLLTFSLTLMVNQRLLGDVRDHASAHERSEQALRQNEERFRMMFERHKAVMLLVEPEGGRIVAANMSAADFYGYSQPTLCSMSMQEINQLPPDRIARERQLALKEKRNFFVVPHCLANGHVRMVEVHSTPLSINGRQLIFEIIHDITERHQTEKLLRTALSQAQQRERETAALLDAGRAVMECQVFAESARRLFDACRQVTGAASGYVALLSEDGEQNEVLFLEAGGWTCNVDPTLPMPVRGLRGEVYHQGQVIYDNDFMNSPWVHMMPPGHMALRNVMFAPLTIHDRVVGVIGLANKPADFNQDDARIAGAFGDMAATSLRRIRAEEALREAHGLLEQRVAERTEELWAANIHLNTEIAERKLAEVERERLIGELQTVIKEVHHRVKNNLQSLISLLNLQARKEKDPNLIQSIHETQTRLRAMALVHESIYRSKSLSRIDVEQYLKKLGQTIQASSTSDARKITLNFDSASGLTLSPDQAIPCGLILNELITNALKYAFPDGCPGEIKIAIREVDSGRLELMVADNGVGLPPEFDWRTTETLGLSLVRILAERQLNGLLQVTRGEGTHFTITFPTLSK